ncbi:hypothetical protein B9S64_29175 [Streptomyces sp. SM18]|nr:hypothetical protein B9S64_29175 [Streptomyces sp. SM18]
MSGSPRYIQYRGDPPPCDRTHQTPPAPPSGRTALRSKHPLGWAAWTYSPGCWTAHGPGAPSCCGW